MYHQELLFCARCPRRGVASLMAREALHARSLLGEGALSTVHLENGLAVKRTRKALLHLLQLTEAALREKAALESVAPGDNPFLAKFRGAAQDDDFLLLYLDPIEASSGTSINLRRLNSSALPAPCVLWLGSCLMSGLAHLRSRRIVHRDVKPENIVLRADGSPVLVDFGCAALLPARGVDDGQEGREVSSLDSPLRSLVGTLPYVAPEVLSREGHGCAADVWSLGVVLHEALCMQPPFSSDAVQWTHAELAQAQSSARAAGGTVVLSTLVPSTGEASQEIRSLLRACLEWQPAERMGMACCWASEHASEHLPWLTAGSDDGTDGSDGGADERVANELLAGGCAQVIRAICDALATADTAAATCWEAGGEACVEEREQAELEAAWAQAECEELLERAETLWHRDADTQRLFDGFGPRLI